MDSKKTVFLVDDDTKFLKVGKKILSDDYNVFLITSGQELLDILKITIPDIILLDVTMPDMDGYETIKHIKDDPNTVNVPVIFLTAKNDSKSEIEGLSLGAIDYITKPFSPPLLLKRVEVHLLVEKQKQELINYNTNLEQMVAAKTETVIELQNAFLKTMAELVEFRDDITGMHIERTLSYLNRMIEELMIPGKPMPGYTEHASVWDIDLILSSAQLHDIGKIAIKDSILQKPTKLDADEFEKIKEHTTFGEKVIDKMKSRTKEQAFLEHARIFAGAHHEKWDGSGYPRGLKGDEISLQGRLMAVADVYDALVSVRPYKKAFTHDYAVKIITEGRGTHFDPVLVDIFLTVAEDFKSIAEHMFE